ncbi:beta-lactamase domain-containing protein, partial [mine drainage metagenome]
MMLRQFLHTDPVAVSYLLGCAGKGAAAIVDPVYPIEPYLDAARVAGTPIRLVIDTHLHADHRSAGRELASSTGADYALHASAETGFAFRGLKHGERIELGNVALDVLHTPGHTPEHLCLLVTDRTRAQDPWCVLTGHTLMVGDVGRTELA